MNVGATHAKGTDCTGTAFPIVLRPGFARLIDIKGTALPVDIVVFLLTVQTGGNYLVAQGLYQADQAD